MTNFLKKLSRGFTQAKIIIDPPINLKNKIAAFKFGNENTTAVPANTNSHFLLTALNRVENQRQQNILHKGGII